MSLKPHTYIIMLLTALVVSCGEGESKDPELQAQLREEAKQTDISAIKAARARDNWKALALFNEADSLYAEADHKDDVQYRYLIYKQRANVLNRLKFYDLAIASMEKSIELLDKAEVFSNRINPVTHRLSAQRYLGTYIRHNGEFLRSNEYLLPLIDYENEKVKGLNAQVKNLIGLNFYDLGDYENAFIHFNDVLKISDLDPKQKAHYLLNRGRAQYYRGNTLHAFNDMSEALGINQTLGRDLYTFINYMELGDLYINEDEFVMANEALDKALLVFSNIDTDPDLFKVYRLKHTAAVGAGLKGMRSFKVKFDDLSRIHAKKKESYTAEEEMAMYAAGIGMYWLNQTPGLEWYQGNSVWIVICILLVVLVIIFVPSWAITATVLKQLKSKGLTDF